MQNRTAIVVWAMGISLLPCANRNLLGAGHEPQARFVLSPNPALMDERVTIQVAGLPPDREVVIRARSKDQSDCWWSSSARFRTRQDGSIDVSAQAPVSGSYRGVDAMGLFWSMEPDRSKRPPVAFFSVVDLFKPLVTELEVVSDSRVLGTAQLLRHFARTGVRAAPFRNNGTAGILYEPGDARKHRGIILLGGSEGGFPSPGGPMLASRGFVVLALAYFGAAELPPAMQRIPMEYFGRALHAMLALPALERGGVTLVGASRGAEAALIVASMYPEVNGVVGISSSHVRWEGATASMLPGGPAWTNAGVPLPYIPVHIGPGFAARAVWSRIRGSALSLEPMFVDSLSRNRAEDVQIAVERIRGPVLLASGSDDKKWPSAWMSKRAMDRLQRNRHPYSDDHISYEGAGHWIPSAYLPTGGLRGSMADEIGGTPEATASVQSKWWPRMLQFLAAIPSP
ncbi:acyl-CoA thioesterase/bile acid-CoA:amino acid N-acyltransferase family protein [Paludibaculum fermentans]|uniref:acyl-CoA thioesterase/bile acid-CoA:amino acid N-acyltransferase family protein n=1 Tax=Paludibaculum fermentans TaxID=1473598 RepID=UPI003EB8CE48